MSLVIVKLVPIVIKDVIVLFDAQCYHILAHSGYFLNPFVKYQL